MAEGARGVAAGWAVLAAVVAGGSRMAEGASLAPFVGAAGWALGCSGCGAGRLLGSSSPMEPFTPGAARWQKAQLSALLLMGRGVWHPAHSGAEVVNLA